MIGIGITTYNRYNLLNLCLQQIHNHIKNIEHELFVYDDTPYGKGIAYGKNECLYHLRDCEHIFLFDDDCFPKKNDWHNEFINKKINQLVYANDKNHNLQQINEGIGVYEGSSGVLMYLTKEIIDKVGYFNLSYGKYGYEHADYSNRVHKAGLIKNPFMSPMRINEYIHSLDFDGAFNNITATSTITDEEKKAYRDSIREFYLKNNQSNKIHLPYNQQL